MLTLCYGFLVGREFPFSSYSIAIFKLTFPFQEEKSFGQWVKFHKQNKSMGLKQFSLINGGCKVSSLHTLNKKTEFMKHCSGRMQLPAVYSYNKPTWGPQLFPLNLFSFLHFLLSSFCYFGLACARGNTLLSLTSCW